jgi:hypothetical protein
MRIKPNEIKKFREEIYKKQNFKCDVLNIDIEQGKQVLDHIHSEHKYYPETGYVRGVIHRDINVLLGKIENQWNRTPKELKEKFELDEILILLANYIKKHKYKDEKYIHPREYKEPKIMKSKYNKLKKLFLEKYPNKKFPEFPKSGKLTKPLEKISKEFNFNLYKEI